MIQVLHLKNSLSSQYVNVKWTKTFFINYNYCKIYMCMYRQGKMFLYHIIPSPVSLSYMSVYKIFNS